MAELGYERASACGAPGAAAVPPAPARSVRGAITRRLRPARQAAPGGGLDPDPALALTVFDRLTGALHTGDLQSLDRSCWPPTPR